MDVVLPDLSFTKIPLVAHFSVPSLKTAVWNSAIVPPTSIWNGLFHLQITLIFVGITLLSNGTSRLSTVLSWTSPPQSPEQW
ncbi:hypothetical protein PFISCL1PPCAC_11800 [Pristionchus fissidentatus]|uniref:Uncharacterized protein n=1 Tax=Pristionchus fissidentatus TaxID=1538716 RepID=A0AAV5VQ78_9BILA|nr:hypothetical protein PFISCL1PPCAC_11800 [Pristionchus fissidentatus]